MKIFLLDTDICIFRIYGQERVVKQVATAGAANCCVSEITIAELRFGAERSNRTREEHLLVDAIYEEFIVLPITPAIRTYATEKARLWNIGQKIDDFDLLIGATAICHDLTLISNNTKHFQRLAGLKLDNWL